MKNTRRFISAVMALAMVSAMAPVSAFAVDTPTEITQDTTPDTNGLRTGTATATYSVQPKYTVVIPANATIYDSADEATAQTISAENVLLENGQSLVVTLATASNTTTANATTFNAKNGDTSTVNYTITAGSGENAKQVALGGEVAKFENKAEKQETSLTFVKSGGTPTVAGAHTETLTFSIAVESAAAAPRYADKVKECEKNESGNWKVSSFYDGTNLNITILSKEEAMALAEYLGGGNIYVVYEPNGTEYARSVNAAGNVSGFTLSLTNSSRAPLYYVPADNT